MSWFLYGLGHFSSKVMEAFDNEYWVGFWYPIYNWFMIASSYTQDKHNVDGPWEHVPKE
jgi:hypothetical protein